MAQHRKLSPSSAHRWMNCPGSIALIGDDSSSAGVEAMRGTAAHKVLELCVQKLIWDASTYAGFFVAVPRSGDGDAELFYPGTADEDDLPSHMFFQVDEKMVDGVQLALDTLNAAMEAMDHPKLFTERFLDMAWLDPRLGGTADLTLIEYFGWAHLLDYKNGYVFVDHRDNEQVMLYGLGIMHENPDIEGVRITIIQPNAPHDEGLARTVEYTSEEMEVFEQRVRDAAEATAMPNAKRRPGDWCKYCPAAGTRCPEFDGLIMEEAKIDFADDPDEWELKDDVPTTPFELAHRARFIPILDIWVKNVKRAIWAECMAGNGAALGKKVVRGKSNRIFPDVKALTARLEEDGLPVNVYAPPKPLSPAKIEKMGVGKDERKLYKKLVKDLAIKPDGKLVIADADDPRDEVDVSNMAADDFTEEEEIEGGEFD